MTGIYMHSLDAKGRLAIPAKMRDELGSTFYVTLSMEKCLTAYSADSWNVFMDKIKAMPKIKQTKMRPLFSHSRQMRTGWTGAHSPPTKPTGFRGPVERRYRCRHRRDRRILGQRGLGRG